MCSCLRCVQAELERALNCLTLEDPSVRVVLNEETGQRLLSGKIDIDHTHSHTA
jgi:hypothetical protein